MDTARIKKYKEVARNARETVLRMIYHAQSSHIGSNFSCIDILSVLFETYVNCQYCIQILGLNE